ncbi:MAG: hypothetical protein ACTHZ1_03365 [Sphingobacterium sp.]
MIQLLFTNNRAQMEISTYQACSLATVEWVGTGNRVDVGSCGVGADMG